MNPKGIILDYNDDLYPTNDDLNFGINNYLLGKKFENKDYSSTPYVDITEAYGTSGAGGGIFPGSEYDKNDVKRVNNYGYTLKENNNNNNKNLTKLEIIENQIWEIKSEIFFLENIYNLTDKEHSYYQQIGFKTEKRRELEKQISGIENKIIEITNQIKEGKNKKGVESNENHLSLLKQIDFLKENKKFLNFIKNNLFKNVSITKKSHFNDKDKIKIDSFIDSRLDILHKELEKLEKIFLGKEIKNVKEEINSII